MTAPQVPRDGYGCGGWRIRQAHDCPDPECDPASMGDCRDCLEERVLRHLLELGAVE
jgi:hypothetical protein